MKHIFSNTILSAVAVVILASGCETIKKSSNQDKGVAVGATSGAVIGGILGNNIGKGKNTALGAILGAAIGGVAGGIIGNKMDKQAEKIKTEIPGAKVERVGEGINVTFDENNPDGSKAGVYFATAKFDITANSKLALDKLVKIFNEYPETNILVEGHTDDVGADAYNMTLSEKRAEAVGNYLKAAGIAASRLSIKWYGEAQPKVDNLTAENRALNRRVEFAVTANEKMKTDAKVEADKNP
ncbi:OmpA family protein [Ferruginibacter sp. HRS2-29]|uniref:OmpA family protein n=1 Tax=Ferruginibacter sp. HRS2-29 TaxID=2487334 RepID=UPI0020CF027A|nr:OmpA family protein [Ferruginibacter sp. HRS2-29]MCP9750428.1 OmpA family protein [Ferruginibacter sp. HRS2-29]